MVGFDLDMTLVDSAAGIAATMAAALADLGFPAAVTPADVWPYIGVPMEGTTAALVPQADPHAVTRRYRELYSEVGLPSISLLPGVLETMQAIRDRGGRVLVVSAKIDAAVRAVLGRVGLDSGPLAPDEIAGGLFAGAKGARLAASGADVYVGDHPGDMDAARVAGAVGVGVATGPHTAAQLTAAGADVVLPDLMAFPDWLAGWWPRVLAEDRTVSRGAGGSGRQARRN